MPQQITPLRLYRAVNAGFKRVENFRKARLMFLREYVGAFYDKAEPDTATPINLIFKAVSILVPNLVAKNPTHAVESRFVAYRQYAELLGLGCDQWALQNDYDDTLRLAITDALFGMATIKCGLAVTGQTLDMDDLVNIASPYADRVDLDDLAVDPMARDRREAAFVADRVRVPRQFCLDSGMFDPDKIAGLPGSTEGQHSLNRSSKESWMLSKGKNGMEDINELIDYIDLVEVWLPDDKVVVTLPYGEGMMGAGDDFLRVVEWQGPDHGPYHFLGFHWVPNNFFPIAPVGIWYDLHQMMNRMAAKATRQADRQKTQGLYRKSAADDAETVIDGNDGEWLGVDDPSAFQTIEWGGVSEKLYQHMAWVDMKFSESGPGDFQQLGGEESGVDTATQAQILNNAASVRLGDMKDLIYKFTAAVSRDVAWYLHTDPLIELPLVKRVRGGEDVQLFLTPEARQGTFLDYTFKIKPMSMRREDPQQQSMRWVQFVNTVFPTALQAFQAFGPLFNPMRFINMMADKWGLDSEGFDAVWNDPEFQMMIMEQMARMPQPVQGQPAGPSGGNSSSKRSTIQGGSRPGAGGGPPDMTQLLGQMFSAPMQPGMGNLSGRPGVSTIGA